MSAPNTIIKAIAAHGMWKNHLHEAIITGKSHFKIEQVRGDSECEFGKWLQMLAHGEQQATHYQTVQALHTQFHQEAARVLQLALTGRKAEAEKAMALGGSFAKVSAQLTLAMTKWRDSLV